MVNHTWVVHAPRLYIIIIFVSPFPSSLNESSTYHMCKFVYCFLSFFFFLYHPNFCIKQSVLLHSMHGGISSPPFPLSFLISSLHFTLSARFGPASSPTPRCPNNGTNSGMWQSSCLFYLTIFDPLASCYFLFFVVITIKWAPMNSFCLKICQKNTIMN